ncbi:uncharacterized protein LOC129572524 [Sitodiplosis mosellana]|uniref:uncharacterized protein LOC129572524 n=1 Tax=Sitodiplosis mosellana TaxID=263140 RepID=UPI002444E898|nr:uncharacterized protein LOC129572524 [Sitodiplosis mosellana]
MVFRPHEAQYNVPKSQLERLESDGIVRKRHEDGDFVYELGMDPGTKTCNATVRRTIKTHKEINFKISSKKYHYLTKRDRKAEKWTWNFKMFERSDREDRNRYERTASLKGSWRDYITHDE